ncbi:MAG: DUF481 domain-containing protein, partial [Halioglobus sp.]
MLGIRIVRQALLGLVLSFSAVAYAEEAAEAVAEAAAEPLDMVLLKNGSKVFGTITSARDGVIVLETDFAGTLNIDATTVDSMTSQGSLVVQLADGYVIRDQPVIVEEDSLLVTLDSGEERPYSMSDVLLMNPEPWELGDGYKPFGLVSFAWALERGNSDTDELDYKLESYWRSLEDRYTLKLNGEIDETNGLKNADNWQVVGKYDYFLERENYVGAKLAAEQDEFQDL